MKARERVNFAQVQYKADKTGMAKLMRMHDLRQTGCYMGKKIYAAVPHRASGATPPIILTRVPTLHPEEGAPARAVLPVKPFLRPEPELCPESQRPQASRCMLRILQPHTIFSRKKRIEPPNFSLPRFLLHPQNTTMDNRVHVLRWPRKFCHQ